MIKPYFFYINMVTLPRLALWGMAALVHAFIISASFFLYMELAGKVNLLCKIHVLQTVQVINSKEVFEKIYYTKNFRISGIPGRRVILKITAYI